MLNSNQWGTNRNSLVFQPSLAEFLVAGKFLFSLT